MYIDAGSGGSNKAAFDELDGFAMSVTDLDVAPATYREGT